MINKNVLFIVYLMFIVSQEVSYRSLVLLRIKIIIINNTIISLN